MKRSILVILAMVLCGTVLVRAAESQASKENYLKMAEANVQEWGAKLKALQQRSEKEGTKTREELDKRLKVVDHQLEIARRKLEDLRSANEGTWVSFRKGLEETLKDVKRDYKNAVSFFNKNGHKEGL